MTASELQKITHPEEEISAEQLAVVEELVDCLPWFSCGQLLLLKAMKQRQHPFFDTRLAFASLYATDRNRLHRYLQHVKSGVAVVADEMPPVQHSAALPATDDGFELLDSDEVCEVVVEAPAQRSEEKVQRREQHIQLIDKFLSTEVPPKIVPRTNVSGEDMAQQSVVEPADLVSETLADVYMSQGLTDKAMQVYGKLSLLYPEKKAYFATRFAAASQSQRSAGLS